MLATLSGRVSFLNGISGSEATRASTTQNTASSESPITIGTSAPDARPAVGPGFHDSVHEDDLAERQRQRAREVKAAFAHTAPVGDHRVGHERGCNPDRRVDQQHPAPAELLCDDAAEQRSGGAACPVHRRPQADRAVKLRAGRERRRDDRQRRRGHERAAEALHAASDDQHAAARREAARQRRDREQDQRRRERPPLPEVVGGAAAEHQEARERDRVRVDDPLQVSRGEVQARLDRRQRDVDDAQVEDHHELRHAADDEDPRRARAQSGVSGRRSGRRRASRSVGARGGRGRSTDRRRACAALLFQSVALTHQPGSSSGPPVLSAREHADVRRHPGRAESTQGRGDRARAKPAPRPFVPWGRVLSDMRESGR